MVLVLVLILFIIVVIRFAKGMFPAFLLLVATKSIMEAFWEVRVGPLSFSSVGGVLIPLLFWSVFKKNEVFTS